MDLKKIKTRRLCKIGAISFFLAACVCMLSGCGDTSAKDGPRNRITGTGEKTKIEPFTMDDHFLEAVRNNDLRGVRARLARGANIAARDGLNSTALLLAVRKTGNPELIRFLVREGKTIPDFINIPDNLNRTPLSWAAQMNKPAVMKFLLDNGARLDQADKSGRTPLFHAVLAGRVSALRFLLKQGAQINPRDRFGDTPLIIAAARGRANIVRILVAKGADATIRNQEGQTALQRARKPEIKKLLR